MSYRNDELKIRREHLTKKAIIYVRQSTKSQDLRNTGSKARQYDLFKFALELGWGHEDVIVVDQDRAKSASSLNGREAFKGVLTEVALGQVGAIFCLMIDRLSRSDFDWPQIFKICQVTDTLIIDEERVWDLNDHNDLTMMGIKGAISASEIRLTRSRCQGGRLKKAEAGVLRFRPPTGFLRDNRGQIIMDPDEQVRQALHMVFELFDSLPSARAVVCHFNQHGLQFPTRVWGGDRHQDLSWGPLLYTRIMSILHNPAYAGAYVWGRTRSVLRVCPESLSETWNGSKRLSPTEWQVVKQDSHHGYISWKRYMRNVERLRRNVPNREEGNPGAARGGTALLSGIILCGKCGRRMSTGYSGEHSNYCCEGDGNRGARSCQSMQGWYVDSAVADALLEALAPAQLRLSLRAVEEAEAQRRLINQQWDLKLERARYEAELARRHLMRVEPEYELVTRTLRGEWEAKLEVVKNLEREREQALRARPPDLKPAERQAVLDLARDLPAVWRADTTTPAERKQIIRLLIKDVALSRHAHDVHIAIRWQTGACSELNVTLPDRGSKHRTDPLLIELIRQLAVDHTDQMIADHLNEVGWKTKKGKGFKRATVQGLRFKNKIPTNCRALSRKVSFDPRGDGRLGTKAVARLLNVGTTTVNRWCREGWLDCTRDAPGSPLWIKLEEDDIRALRRPLRRGHTAPPPRIKPSSAKAIAKSMVNDSVWEAIAPLMPPEPEKINGGRTRVSNRAVLCSVLFILRYEITWWALPQELGWGCGANCRRRFLDWLKTGAWARIQAKLVKLLPDGRRLEWRRTFS